jgi:hypothetical protein
LPRQRNKRPPLRKLLLLNSKQTRKQRKLFSEKDLPHGRKLKLKDYHFLLYQELLRKS